MSDGFGLLEHMDRRGTPCAWCGEPSVDTLIVAPAPKGALNDIRAGVCELHRREPEPPPLSMTFRRRRSPGAHHQLGMDIDV